VKQREGTPYEKQSFALSDLSDFYPILALLQQKNSIYRSKSGV
jgi:hypothetical protein